MAGCEVFDQVAEVNSFKNYEARLIQENPNWTFEKVLKQAQIYYNTEALPNQVKSFFAEKRGDKISHVDAIFKIIGDCLYNNFYSFKKMVDRATPGIARNTLMDFQHAAIIASPGQTITILDTSGLDIGKGIKYFDTYIKTNDDTLQHLQRYDLTGDQPTLTIDQAKQFLVNLGILDGRQLIADKDKDSLGVLVLPATEDISVFNEQVEAQVDRLLATPEIPAIELIDAFQPQWITDWGIIESLSSAQLPTQKVQAAATLITTEIPIPIFVANETSLPTRLDLVGIEDKPVIIFEAPHTAVDEEIPVRMFLEGYLEGDKSQEEFTDKDFETPKNVEDIETISTRLDLVGLVGISKVKVETQTVDLEETKSVAVTVFETPIVEPMVINLEPKEKFKPLATTKQQLNDTVVEARCCFPEQDVPFQNKIPIAAAGSIFIRPARSLLAGKLIEPEKEAVTVVEKQQLKVTTVRPTRLDLEGLEGANDIQTAGEDEEKSNKKVVFSADNRKTAALKISRAAVELRRDSKEIPIYEIKWPSLKPIKGIPEWVWQGTAAGPDEII
ncbi:MAG: hypothetical protein ABH810_00575, partial [bacterium]